MHRTKARAKKRAGRASSVFTALVLAGSLAHADPKIASDDAKRQAREAYGRGEAALARQDYATAVAEFTHADHLVPNDTALVAALEALVHTDDPKVAVNLLNRIEQRTVSTAVASAAKTAGDQLDGLVGRIVIECPTKATCNAELDNTPVVMGKIRWVVPGTHWLHGSVNALPPVDDGIDVKAGQLASVPLGSVRAPVVNEVPEAPPEAPDGPSPVLFWIGVGVTVVLAGVATWSTFDHGLKSKDARDTGCTDNPNANTACTRFLSDDDSSGKRTLFLWGATGVVALATAFTGLFVVHWRHGHAAIGRAPGSRYGSVGFGVEQRF